VLLRPSEGTLSRWSRLHLQSFVATPVSRKVDVRQVASRKNNYRIFITTWWKTCLPTPLSRIRVGKRRHSAYYCPHCWGTGLPYGLPTRRTGHNPPRGTSGVLTTANATGTNGLTCLPKHGGARDDPSDDRPKLLSFSDRTPSALTVEPSSYASKIQTDIK
jgi:hypothetical protein